MSQINEERLLKVLLAPHMSEKAAIAAEKRREYVFEVISDATKPEVKGAVELLFKTKVSAVRIVNVKSKPRRFGKISGKSKTWKKAYVTLLKGQEISFAGAQ
jgi:large subunit ribosomal protein L23